MPERRRLQSDRGADIRALAQELLRLWSVPALTEVQQGDEGLEEE